MDGVTLTFRLYRLSWQMKAQAVEASFRRLVQACKYNPNQPRVPAGTPDGGQWTDGNGGGGGGGDSADERTTGEVTPSNAQRITGDYAGGEYRVAGGFTDEDMGTTVGAFASAKCQGLVHRMLPGEFYDSTIAEVAALAKGGNAAAKRCIKILGRDEYRK